MSHEVAGGARRRRRTPRPEERQRDAERTQGKILDAAVVEFGANGYAGARVAEIAARAGVNVQLISYYFGGKAGLYRELNARWQVTGAELSAAASLADVVIGFARASATHRDWTRLMVWDGLTGSPAEAAAEQDTPADKPDVLSAAVKYLRHRQDAGELPAGLDPAHLMLALFAAASAPIVLPGIAQQICETDDPTSPKFVAAYADTLGALVRLLGDGRRPT